MRTRNAKRNKQKGKTRGGGLIQTLNDWWNPMSTSTYAAVKPSVTPQVLPPDYVLLPDETKSKCDKVRTKLTEFEEMFKPTDLSVAGPLGQPPAGTEIPLSIDEEDTVQKLKSNLSKEIYPIINKIYEVENEMDKLKNEQECVVYFHDKVKPFLIEELNQPSFQNQNEEEVKLEPILQGEFKRTTKSINEELHHAIVERALNTDYHVLFLCFQALQRFFPTEFMQLKTSLAEVAREVQHQPSGEKGLQIQKTTVDNISILFPIQLEFDSIMPKVHEIREKLPATAYSENEKRFFRKVLKRILDPATKNDMVQYFKKFLDDEGRNDKVLYYFLAPTTVKVIKKFLGGTSVPEIDLSDEVANLLKSVYTNIATRDDNLIAQIVRDLFDVYITTLHIFLKKAIEGPTKEFERSALKNSLLSAIIRIMDSSKKDPDLTKDDLSFIQENEGKVFRLMGGMKRKTRHVKKRRTRHVNRKR